MTPLRLIPAAVVCCLGACSAFGQDSYEIQVYGSETIPKGKTMVELHSNFTVEGEGKTVNGVLPSRHALHETLEVTHGFTPWFETGFYVFTSLQPHGSWEWVGDHIRPRIRVPDEWQWPVGLSLSTEFGYQQRRFSEDTWTWEIRPIIDKEWGRWYFALNPALEKSVHGGNTSEDFEFAPSAKVSYEVTKLISLGLEWYASYGPVSALDSSSGHQEQIFPVVDLNFSDNWEFNFGVGFGLTESTDDLLVKLILGRRF